MTRAAVTGAVDFSTFDFSRRWWVAMRLRLDVMARTMTEQVFAVDAVRASMVQAMTDTDMAPGDRQAFAIRGVQKFREYVMPWLPATTGQNASTPLDAISQWYATFAPEKLKPHG